MPDQLTVEFDVPATMRDGVVLRANVFRPADGGRYPVALARTPYGKDFSTVVSYLDAPRLARAGYVVVVQDVRGRGASGGEWAAFKHEALDGYDTVEWAARLPGADGQVGMFGASYYGFTQWMAARETPPSLKAIMPAITWANALDGTVARGGALELGLLGFWQLNALAPEIVLKRARGLPPAEQARAVGALLQAIDTLRAEGYRSLPLESFEPLRQIGLLDQIAELLDNFENPEYFAPYSIASAYERVRVPALNIGGWYDIFANGTLQNFSALRAGGATPEARQSQLVIGPWAHVATGNTIGQADFGFAAQLGLIDMQTDPTGLTQRWFDYWMKGVDNGVDRQAPIKLFVMGANRWRDEQEWPLARAQATPFYLRAGGWLATEPPTAGEPADEYTYDPADPTPLLGGSTLMHPLFGVGPHDQRALEARPDVLSYTSAPLERDTEVTGPLLATLWAASDAPDTDFVARLVDVHPDGFAQNLADGIVRARYRDGLPAKPLEPGRPYELSIDLWATANLFKIGHRIRVDIASASFPRWDRNLNTGAPASIGTQMRPARQRILHDAEHPSRIVLPVVPAAGAASDSAGAELIQ